MLVTLPLAVNISSHPFVPMYFKSGKYAGRYWAKQNSSGNSQPSMLVEEITLYWNMFGSLRSHKCRTTVVGAPDTWLQDQDIPGI